MIPVVMFGLASRLVMELNENENANYEDGEKHGLAVLYESQEIQTGICPPCMMVGKLEKGEPLPEGKYWIDVFAFPDSDKESGIDIFNTWAKENKATVHIVNREQYYEGGDGYFSTDPKQWHEWIAFDVKAPTPWKLATKIGWPTIRKEGESTKDDTVEKLPPEQTPLDWLEQPNDNSDWSFGGFPVWGYVVGAVVVLFAVGYAARGLK